jgi:putative ABC transport system ATP-binding protein
VSEVAESPSPIVALSGVRKTFDRGRVTVLREIDLTVQRGSFVAITGASGCGKSTLLHLIAALDRPTTGTICVDGRDLAHRHDLNRYRRSIGLVFQLHNLLPHLAAVENVELALFGTHRSAGERHEMAGAMLERLGIGAMAARAPTRLSGGERQRVAIARALAGEPTLLLADEPTANLDHDAVAVVLALFDQLRRERQMTVVMVTHDTAAAAAAERRLELRGGRLHE